MTEELGSQEPYLIHGNEDFLPLSAPVVYVDGITHIAPGPHIVKMNFARVEASMLGSGETRIATTLQLIMVIGAFIQTAQFMTNIVDGLVATGRLTKEEVEEIRKTAGGQRGDRQ